MTRRKQPKEPKQTADKDEKIKKLTEAYENVARAEEAKDAAWSAATGIPWGATVEAVSAEHIQKILKSVQDAIQLDTDYIVCQAEGDSRGGKLWFNVQTPDGYLYQITIKDTDVHGVD